MHVIECLSCDLAWRTGALGYDLIRAGTKHPAKQAEGAVMEGLEIEPEVWDLGEEERSRQLGVRT